MQFMAPLILKSSEVIFFYCNRLLRWTMSTVAFVWISNGSFSLVDRCTTLLAMDNSEYMDDRWHDWPISIVWSESPEKLDIKWITINCVHQMRKSPSNCTKYSLIWLLVLNGHYKKYIFWNISDIFQCHWRTA